MSVNSESYIWVCVRGVQDEATARLRSTEGLEDALLGTGWGSVPVEIGLVVVGAGHDVEQLLERLEVLTFTAQFERPRRCGCGG